MKNINCYNCQSEKRIFYAAENGYSLVKCRECGLLYLAERPDNTEILQAHKQGKHTGLKELDVTGAFNKYKVLNYLKVLNDIYKEDFGSNIKWLDIGCGHGEFIVALQKYSLGAICATGSEPNIHKQESGEGKLSIVCSYDYRDIHWSCPNKSWIGLALLHLRQKCLFAAFLCKSADVETTLI